MTPELAERMMEARRASLRIERKLQEELDKLHKTCNDLLTQEKNGNGYDHE